MGGESRQAFAAYIRLLLSDIAIILSGRVAYLSVRTKSDVLVVAFHERSCKLINSETVVTLTNLYRYHQETSRLMFFEASKLVTMIRKLDEIRCRSGGCASLSHSSPAAVEHVIVTPGVFG
jgi:hypothetical protein